MLYFITSMKFMHDAIQIHATDDTDDANTVLIVIRDFKHVMYIKKEDLVPGCGEYVLKTKTDGYGFHEPSTFAEFSSTLSSEFFLKKKAFSERGIMTYQTFLDPVERCMLVKDVYGGLWIEVIDAKKMDTPMITTLMVDFRNVRPLPDIKKYPKRFRVSSFDIESAKGHCIQITTINYVLNENFQEITSETKVWAQTMRYSKNIPGVIVKCYGDHQLSLANMLKDWCHEIIIKFDPDVIMGHNIKNYDIPELLRNAALCGISSTFSFSRPVFDFKTGTTVRPPVTATEREQGGTKQSGFRQQTDVTCTRIIMDTLEVMMMDLTKYDYYNLDFLSREILTSAYVEKYVCKDILGVGKHEVTYEMIEPMYDGTLDERTDLLAYNVQDSVLPFEMMMALKKMAGMVEMARAAKVQLDWVTGRGVECKAMSLLTEAGYRNGFVFPAVFHEMKEEERRETEASLAEKRTIHEKFKKAKGPRYGGATVIATKAGIYEEPITTLDYASLYPSIMRGYNLCPTTWVRPEDLEWVQQKYDVIKTSHGDYFIDYHINAIEEKEEAIKSLEARIAAEPDLAPQLDELRASFAAYMSRRRKGIAPQLLDRLVAQRGATKRDMKKYKDTDVEYAILDGKQNAEKLVCNGFYGAMGSPTFKIPCISVAASVTKYGQDGLAVTESIAKEMYPNMRLIAGDTDSLMILGIYGEALRKRVEEWKVAPQPKPTLRQFFENVETIRGIMEEGAALAKLITKRMNRKPMEIAWEKLLFPAVFPCQLEEKRELGETDEKGVKKNYYARKLMHWTDILVDENDPKSVEKYNKRLLMKGIGVVRRDYCKFVRRVGERVCRIMVMDKEGGVQPTLAYLAAVEREMEAMRNRTNPDYRLLKTSKNNGKEKYAAAMNPITRLIQLNKERNGAPIKLGDRIPYYVICNGYSNKELSMKVEHAAYVEDMSNKVVIDIDYYKKKQMRNLMKKLIPYHETEVDRALFPHETLTKKPKKLCAHAPIKVKEASKQENDMFRFASKVDARANFANISTTPLPIPPQNPPQKVIKKEKKEKPIAAAVVSKKTVTLLDFFSKK